MLDERLNSTLQGCAAIWMTIGQGATEGFYFGMNGYYIKAFGNKAFFVSMLLCVMAPKPFMSVLQQIFDAYFDERLSTAVTYAFRVISMQLILAAIILTWMLAASSQSLVLLIGFLIGMLGSAQVSSSLQLVAAMAPENILNAKIGMQIGGLIPVIVMAATQFTPASSVSLFRAELATLVVLCITAASILFAFHFRSDIFTKAYKRLSYDLTSSLASTSESDELLSGEGIERQITATRSLSPEGTEGVPSWVWPWQVCVFLMMAFSMYLLSLAGFFQSPLMAQSLSLLRLVMEFVGRVGGMSVPYFPSFEQGPWHKVMVASFILTLCFGSIVLVEMFTDCCSKGVLFLCWGCVFAVSIFANSLCDLTTGAYSEVKDRKQIARTSAAVVWGGYLFGLICSFATSSLIEAHSMAHP